MTQRGSNVAVYHSLARRSAGAPVTVRRMARGIPAGTVTFLFTRIEGSARLWEEAPAEMADAHALEKSQQTLAADAKFAEFVDESVKGVYVDEPSLTQQRILRRIM